MDTMAGWTTSGAPSSGTQQTHVVAYPGATSGRSWIRIAWDACPRCSCWTQLLWAFPTAAPTHQAPTGRTSGTTRCVRSWRRWQATYPPAHRGACCLDLVGEQVAPAIAQQVWAAHGARAPQRGRQCEARRVQGPSHVSSYSSCSLQRCHLYPPCRAPPAMIERPNSGTGGRGVGRRNGEGLGCG